MAELDFSDGGTAVEDLPDFSKHGHDADSFDKFQKEMARVQSDDRLPTAEAKADDLLSTFVAEPLTLKGLGRMAQIPGQAFSKLLDVLSGPSGRRKPTLDDISDAFSEVQRFTGLQPAQPAEPRFDIKLGPTGEKIAGGIAQTGKELAEGVIQPENALMLATGSGIAPRLFQLSMAGAVPEATERLLGARDTKERVAAGLGLAATAALPVAIARGIAKPSPKIPLTTGRVLEMPEGAKPTEIIQELRREGVTLEDAQDLVAGKKTVKEVVGGNFEIKGGVRPAAEPKSAEVPPAPSVEAPAPTPTPAPVVKGGVKPRYTVRNDSKEFDRLVLDHAVPNQWTKNPDLLYAPDPGRQQPGSIGITHRILQAAEMKRVRAQAAKELGLDPDQIGNPTYRAQALPKLKTWLDEKFPTKNKQAENFDKATEAGKEKVPVEKLKVGDALNIKGEPVKVTDVDAEGNVTLENGTKFGTQVLKDGTTIYAEEWHPSAEIGFDPEPETAATPKLRPGEKGTGELLQGAEQPFNLASETTVDPARLSAEKSAAEKRAAEGAAIAAKQQPSLPGTEPGPATGEGQTDINKGALGEVGMGGAKPGEFSPPTIGDLINPELRQKIGGYTPERAAATLENPTPGLLRRVASFFSESKTENLSEAMKGWLGTMAGKTLPRTTLKDRIAGELGGRWVASRAAAAPMGNVFVNDVLTGLPVDQTKFHGALLADNLLSIKDAFTAEAAKLKTQAEAKGSPELIDQSVALEDAAANVNTLIGTEKFPFKTEAELQAYFKTPEVAEAVKRHRENWTQTIEQLYRTTQNIDPEVELPTRGKYSQARLNLNPIIEGEYKPGNGPIVGSAGTLTGTIRKRNPFARKAMGTGQAYVLNYSESIANSFAKQLEIANKKAFEDRLVETGNAKISEPGKQIKLEDGSATKAYPLVRRGFQNKWIYVRGSLAKEYEIAANVILNPYQGKILTEVNKGFAQAALAGLTDATVHVENLATAAFQIPGSTGTQLLADSLLSAAGRLDIPVTMFRGLSKAAPHLTPDWIKSRLPQGMSDAINRALMKHMTQLASIAQMNASRIPHGARFLGFKQLSQGVLKADQVTRMVLDDAFQNLIKQGLVKSTETNRRELINQAGAYNLRSQGEWIRFLRQTWLAPFVTAGRNFATLGIRALTLNPGVEASSIRAASALRANMAAKWIGSAALVAALNYLITGKMLGRPGTKFGSVDTGKDDKRGNPLSFDLLAFTGQSRALRTVGARSAIDAARLGLPKTDVASAAVRDIANTALGATVGPGPRFAVEALTGYPPAMSVGRASSVVPPGENQFVENVKSAALQANPITASIQEYRKPGGSLGRAISRQLPRFALATGRQADLVENYPKVVQMAQANAFVEDMIRQARRLPADDRRKFVNEQIKRLPAQLRDHAEKEVTRRSVFKYGGKPLTARFQK